MRMVLIGGSARDEALLAQLMQRGGFGIEVARLPVHTLLGRAAAGPNGDMPSEAELPRADRPEPSGLDAPLRALVFEVLQRPDLSAGVLAAVRADRAFEAVPAIISISFERGGWLDRVRGFDDFVAHPWSAAELLGRIQTTELRRGEVEAGAIVQIGGIWMDKGAREAHVDGRPIHLTAREFALLAYLCVRRGCVLSRNHLLLHVWGQSYVGGPRTVDVHIRRLRSKLGPSLRIDTVRSGGYRLCADNRVRPSTERTVSPTDSRALPAGHPWAIRSLNTARAGSPWALSRPAPG